VNLLIIQAAAFWVLHGNLLPFVRDWFDIRYYSLPARQHLSEFGVRSFLSGAPTEHRQQLATMHQAVIEEGEGRLMLVVDTLARMAFPTIVMSLCALIVIFWWIPVLGFILLGGGLLDLAITFHANTRLKDRFARQQDLAFSRQRQHREIFNNILRILSTDQSRPIFNDYRAGYAELTRHAKTTQTFFLGYRLGRDVVLNATNYLTWVVGAWYVYSGACSIGVFLMVLAWGARATELFGLVTHLHKVWLDHSPAARAYFSAIDNPNEAPRVDAPMTAPAFKATGVAAPRTET
jgi:ABC-type bacteriocin/lantibiotic exporter with double-glycine peptidase domain